MTDVAAIVVGVMLTVLFFAAFIPWLVTRKQNQKNFETELQKSMSDSFKRARKEFDKDFGKS